MNIRLDLRVVTVSSVTSVLPSSSPLKPAPESEKKYLTFCFHPFPSIVSLTSFDGFSRISKYFKLTWYRHLSKTDYSHLWEILGRWRHIVQDSYGPVSAGREKWANFVLKKYFLVLYCDQTVRLFQLFSTVLKRFCLLESKNGLVLVLSHFFD